MNVEIAAPADIALRTLSEDDRQRALAWQDHLRNWEGDQFVRTHSHKLSSSENTYVLQTSTDLRIFFTKEDDKITVFDIAKLSALLASSNVSAVLPFGSRLRTSLSRPSSSNVVKPCTSDQARAMSAA